MDFKKEALEYHSRGRKGKVEVIPSKPCATQRDLSMAYTPGVAEPCRKIEQNAEDAYTYTAKGNLVAVISNGTAVLGLGNIGALAGKPVMEGKGVLFKRFADIDVFDIELNTEDSDELIRAVQLMEPTFGGVNLEDIKAPECFYIEETLKKTTNIPIFHDDQHGTAIISGAALLNACVGCWMFDVLPSPNCQYHSLIVPMTVLLSLKVTGSYWHIVPAGGVIPAVAPSISTDIEMARWQPVLLVTVSHTV